MKELEARLKSSKREHQSLPQKRQSERGATALMLAVFASVVGFGVIKAVKGKLNNSVKQQKYSIDDLHLQQGCTEGLELASQLLGSAILNIDSNMNFVANSKVPSNLASSIKLGTNDKRNWNIDNQGYLKVSKCMSMNRINEDNVFSAENNSLPKGDCNDDQMISASIKPTKVLDPANEDYAHLVWQTAVVDSTCKLGSGKTLQAKARINFLPPSQICDYESEDNAEFCNVDHCKFMTPLMVSESKGSENKGDVYLDQSGGELNYSLIPNPNYKARLEFPLVDKIPQVEAFLHPDDDQVVMDPPEDLVKFVTQAICPGLNNPFETWQGVEGKYNTTQFFDESKKVNGKHIFHVPAYSKKGKVDISNNAAVLNAREAALEFKGYLYFERGTSFMQGNGSAQLNWQASLQRANPKRHKQLLRQGCQRTVGITDVDFCSRLDLSHAYFDYSYPKKRLCTYEGPAGITSSQYASFVDELAPDLPIGSMKPWTVNPDLKVTGPWIATNEDEPGFYNYSSVERPDVYKDPLDYYHHKFDVRTSISDQGTKVAHDFSGVVTSVINLVEVKEVDVAVVMNCPTPPAEEEPANPGQGNGGNPKNEEEPAPVEAEVALEDCTETESFIVEENPDADLEGFTVVKKLKQRSLTVTWRADCRIEEAVSGENIAIANSDPICASVGSSLKLQPAADKKFDKCYYIAYYDSSSRHNCQIGVPPAGHHYECRNNNGCFAKGTPILMADGKYKPIEQVKNGELVLNPVTLAPANVVSVIVGPQKKPMFKIFYDKDGKEAHLTATYNHPFVGRAGFVRAEELKQGDQILLETMQFAPIKRIESIPLDPENLVYNLTLEEDELSQLMSGQFKASQSLKNHMFTANGVVTGDYFIQSKPNLSDENEFLMLSKFKQPNKEEPTDHKHNY